MLLINKSNLLDLKVKSSTSCLRYVAQRRQEVLFTPELLFCRGNVTLQLPVAVMSSHHLSLPSSPPPQEVTAVVTSPTVAVMSRASAGETSIHHHFTAAVAGRTGHTSPAVRCSLMM